MNNPWQIYNNFKAVETDFISLLRYIDLEEHNYHTTSAEIRKIILSSCAIIERSGSLLIQELGVSTPKEVNAAEIYKIARDAGYLYQI